MLYIIIIRDKIIIIHWSKQAHETSKEKNTRKQHASDRIYLPLPTAPVFDAHRMLSGQHGTTRAITEQGIYIELPTHNCLLPKLTPNAPPRPVPVEKKHGSKVVDDYAFATIAETSAALP
mmetsp:Transcript_14235/g.23264  ORF Transcript_14235/g.23264 Transcript_14235/m.23264 type:complete len:120 (+) Transcript_14235:13-372(+)